MKISSFVSVALFTVAVLSTLTGKIFLRRSIYIPLLKTIKFTFSFFFTDARDEESLTMRNFNADFHPSDKQILAMLKNASLESHGFNKEVITLVRRDPKTNSEMFEKRHFYYQVVHCSRASEVVKKLEALMPVPITANQAQKTISEIKVRKLTTMKQCKVGVEIHFKNGNQSSGKKKARRVRRSGAWICGVCIAITAIE